MEQGADILDVGGVKAGPGPEVGEAEELDRVVAPDRGARAALRRRHLLRHLARRRCSTPRAPWARSSATTSPASATPTTSRSRRSTTRRWWPRTSGCSRGCPTPTRTTTTCSATSPRSCSTAPHQAEAAGLAPEQISHRRRTRPRQVGPAERGAAARERRPRRATATPLLLSASNKRFFGELLELEIDERRAASLASVAYGVVHGCRIVRVHDVAGTVAVCRMTEALLGRRCSGCRPYLVKGSEPSLRDGWSTSSSTSCSATTTAASRSRRSPSPGAPSPGGEDDRADATRLVPRVANARSPRCSTPRAARRS